MNTPAPDHDQATEKMELALGQLLRIGVGLSIALITLGLLVSFIRHPNFVYDQGALHTLVTKDAVFPSTIPQIYHGLATMPGRAIICLGLLVLLATPILRVAVSAMVFFKRKDWPFAFLTTAVLLVLIISILSGHVE